MKDTIHKNKRRQVAFNDYNKYIHSWNLSYKYSKILINNINDPNLFLLCLSTYGEYIKSVKKLYKTKNIMDRNFIQIWETMINTVRKGEDNMKFSIRLLHQTNIQHIYQS